MPGKWATATIVAGVVAALGFAGPAAAGPTLDKIKQGGSLSCGVPTCLILSSVGPAAAGPAKPSAATTPATIVADRKSVV